MSVFVALGIQHTMRMCHIFICAYPTLTTFFHISHKRHDFSGGKKILNMKCVFRFSLQLLSETFFILRRNERDMTKNVYWSSCYMKTHKYTIYPLFLSDFNET